MLEQAFSNTVSEGLRLECLQYLRDRVAVCVIRASEVSKTVVFDVSIDNVMLDWDGFMSATLSPGPHWRPWKVSGFADDVRQRLDKAAHYTGFSLDDVETVVRECIEWKLWVYENWNFDEEFERANAEEMEEAA